MLIGVLLVLLVLLAVWDLTGPDSVILGLFDGRPSRADRARGIADRVFSR